jgi:hypothetical protein
MNFFGVFRILDDFLVVTGIVVAAASVVAVVALGRGCFLLGKGTAGGGRGSVAD